MSASWAFEPLAARGPEAESALSGTFLLFFVKLPASGSSKGLGSLGFC